MIPVLCNPVATQPYMNLPLKNNSVNDISVNAQNPSNTGVTTTTGIFGETDGAMNWADATDRLSWASSVGNTVSSKIGAGATVLYFINQRTLSVGQTNMIFSQIPNSAGQRSFYIQHLNLSSPSIPNGIQLVNYNNGVDGTGFNSTNILSYASWEFFSLKYIDNTTDLNIELEFAGDKRTTTGFYKPKTDSSVELRLGARAEINTVGNFGKMAGFRFYDVTLTDGEIAVLNQQMGRVA